MHAIILSLTLLKFTIGSLIYSFVVSTKLNFIFYSPAILAILLNELGVKKTIQKISLMALVQVLIYKTPYNL